MKYEICRRTKVDGLMMWSAIAWTDVLSYAKDIVSALSIIEGGNFAILHNGEVVY